jgi:plastocyanin
MFKRAPTALSALVFAAASVVAFPVYADEAETKMICDKAEKAYQSFDKEYHAKPGEVAVLMYKYTFCPPTVTVKPGTTVRWINVEKRTSHSVWLKQQGQDESERLFPEESWYFTYTEPGSYPYLCGPHWEKEGMIGTVTVAP